MDQALAVARVHMPDAAAIFVIQAPVDIYVFADAMANMGLLLRCALLATAVQLAAALTVHGRVLQSIRATTRQ